MAVFWKQHDDDRGAEQAEADGEHAGHAAGAEGDLEGAGQRAALGRGRGADVAPHGQAHADEAGEARTRGSRRGRRASGRCPTGTKLEHGRGASSGFTTLVEVTNTRTASGTRIMAMVLNWRLQVGQGALLDGERRSPASWACPGRRRGRPSSGRSRRRWPAAAVRGREHEPEPLAAPQVEGLVPPFGGERRAIMRTAPFSAVRRWPLRPPGCACGRRSGWATFSPTVRSWPSTRSTSGPSNGCFSRTSTSTPGRSPSVSRKATTSGSVEPGHGDHGDVARLEGVQRRHLRDVVDLGRGDREAVRAGDGPVEGDEEPVLDLLGQVVLEARRPAGRPRSRRSRACRRGSARRCGAGGWRRPPRRRPAAVSSTPGRACGRPGPGRPAA